MTSKGRWLGTQQNPIHPLSLVDVSLKETYPDDEWLARAQSAISRCDVFIVLLGNHTHQATGVLQEVGIAKGLKKRRFQLKPHGSNARPVQGGGPVVNWAWQKLHRAIYG